MSSLTAMMPSLSDTMITVRSAAQNVATAVKETASKICTAFKENPQSASRLAVVGLLASMAIIQAPFADLVEDRDLRLKMALATTCTSLMGAAFLHQSDKTIVHQEKSTPKIKFTWENTDSDEYIREAIKAKKEEIEGPDTREIVFVVLPHADHNRAFSLQRRENRENWDRVINKYRVEWTRAEKPSEITQIMSHVNEKISHLWIQVHGLEDAMEFGKCYNGTLSTTDLSEDLFPNLDPKAHILLSACLTGSKNGIGEAFAKTFPDATVLAPNQEYSTEMIYFHDNKPYFLTLNDDGEMCNLQCVNQGELG